MSTRYVGENDSLDTLWELREIDAWVDCGGGWTWNDSFVLKRFRSDADDLKGLFLRVLADVRCREACSGSTIETGTYSRSSRERQACPCGRWCG